MIKKKRKQREEDTREDFFTLCGHGVSNWVHYGHTLNENVYLCTYAKCFFVAEASPSVQFVTASLGNVVMEKKKRKKKKKLFNNVLTVAQSKTNCHCVVFNMDLV